MEKFMFIVEFDTAFKKAVVNPENINEDGSINWNFVDADINMDLQERNIEIDQDLYYEEFDFAASEYEEMV